MKECISKAELAERDPLSWPEKTLFQPSLFLISWNTAQLKLKTIWMITFIISHNEHSCPSCDVILSERSVPASDVRLLPIRSLPTRAQAGTPLSPHHPPPLPLSGGLRADWQHLSSSLFLLCIRFWPPPLPSLCELTSPHITRFSPSQHTRRHCRRDPVTLMVIVCRLCHWQQNSLQAFFRVPFKCVWKQCCFSWAPTSLSLDFPSLFSLAAIFKMSIIASMLI